MLEWLESGLQNRVHGFNSRPGLQALVRPPPVRRAVKPGEFWTRRDSGRFRPWPQTVNAVLWYTYNVAKKRSWTAEQLEEVVKQSFSFRQVIKKLGLVPAGGNYYQLQKYIKEYGFDTTHFRGKAWNKGLRGIGKPRILTKEVLVRSSTFQSYKLKLRLFKEGLKPQRCEQCGWSERAPDSHLPLEVDHINGDRTDHRIENLQILCPNCHSLTSNYRYRRGKKN